MTEIGNGGKRKAMHALGERDGWGCHYCKTQLVKVTAEGEYDQACVWYDGRTDTPIPVQGFAWPTRDHMDPDGPDMLDNLVLACARCNSAKGRKEGVVRSDDTFEMAEDEEIPFAQIPNQLLRDNTLSPEARWLAAYLMTHSSVYKVTMATIIHASGHGRDKAYRELGEVMRAGYVERITERDPKGKFIRYRYIVRKRPFPDSPDTGKPYTAEPLTANPHTKKNTKSRKNTKTSPNGDGGDATDGRADTIVGQAITTLGFTPVERGAFAKIITEAARSTSSTDLLLRAVREWGHAGEPVSYLANRIGTADREARARERRKTSPTGRGVSHDGTHDPGCWCAAKGAAPPPGGVLASLERVGSPDIITPTETAPASSELPGPGPDDRRPPGHD